MDANGTRFHLLQGAADWPRWRTPDPAGDTVPLKARDSVEQVQFLAGSGEITLWPRAFRFPAARGDQPVAPEDRRGAARDAYGNWYWIAPGRDAILVRNAGDGAVSRFWPVREDAAPPAPGDFRPVQPPQPRVLALQGLAVTEDHYLVAGTLAPGGLLVFDLHAGGAPRERAWPVPFAPWDLAARPGGGVLVLDRVQRVVWPLDRRFDVDAEGPAALRPVGDFVPEGGAPAGPQPLAPRAALSLDQAWPLSALADPLAIEVLADGSALVLERRGADGFAAVQWLRAGIAAGAPASTAGLALHIEDDERAPFTFVAHDFALVPREPEDDARWAGRVLVVGPDGNQAYGFGLQVEGDTLSLVPVTSFWPMRLFSGKALVGADGGAWYDSGDRMVRLTGQCRPRHAEQGELWTPLLDGLEPGCVWHRLRLDAQLPPGTAIEVWSRASDDWRELMPLAALTPEERAAFGAPLAGEDPEALAGTLPRAWQREPDPRPRGDGRELPFVPPVAGRAGGTFELLFQRAVGRFAQVRLVLRGDGRATPRLKALRAWYPRFSYLQHYLPAVYRDDAVSASFLDRLLANFEGLFTTMEDRIAAAQVLFDPASTPAEALDWLARWFGLALDPAWDEDRRRLLLRHAMRFLALRGTARGLQAALRLALDECVDDEIFLAAGDRPRRPDSVRIIERFRTRRTPGLLAGDVGTAVSGLPQAIAPEQRWRPALGGAELRRRYVEALGLSAGASFPMLAEGAPAGWSGFAQRELGFVPGSAAAERAAWQAFQQRVLGAVAWGDVPADAPTDTQRATTWARFVAEDPSADRRRWQAFLARRHQGIAALNTAWRTRWAAFAEIALPDRLPPDGDALADWYAFEGTVRAMHAHAHRFTVMLPVPRSLRQDATAQQRRLALARRVLELEKPAHTVFDLRFFWAMFRVGEARLGDDTLVDLGSRAPGLMGPMVLGTGALSETYLAATAGQDAPDRLQVGRDRIGRSTRLGGP